MHTYFVYGTSMNNNMHLDEGTGYEQNDLYQRYAYFCIYTCDKYVFCICIFSHTYITIYNASYTYIYDIRLFWNTSITKKGI